jgi:hypothetical protein
VGNIDLKMISAIANSNKFQKTRFWKEKSVENAVKLASLLLIVELRLLISKIKIQQIEIFNCTNKLPQVVSCYKENFKTIN